MCSYKPIIITDQGRRAVKEYNLSPFVDASCRREPDFQSMFPSITSVCRGSLFAPRLHEGDFIVNITVKGNHLGEKESHWRFVAILEVEHRFGSHSAAAKWYENQGTPLPSNCFVAGNQPLSYEKTAGVKPADKYGDSKFPKRVVKKWDSIYKLRVRKNPTFLVCKSHFTELYEPPILHTDDMISVFGKDPVTRNPPGISETEFRKLR